MNPAPNVGGGVDDNSCVEVRFGGILGGGAGAAASRGDGRWWAIPLASLVAVCLDVRLMGLRTVPLSALLCATTTTVTFDFELSTTGVLMVVIPVWVQKL